MVIVEVVFLTIFWTWFAVVLLFLRETRRSRVTITPAEAEPAGADPVRFQATDGVWLSGWVRRTDDQRPWIILCHGLSADHGQLGPMNDYLVASGYNCLSFDFRAHGTSDGRTCSYGLYEQRDLEGALAFLGKTTDLDRPHGVIGVSMGAAVAAMVAARDDRFGALFLDSPYVSLHEALGHHIRLKHRLPAVPFQWFAASAYKLRFGPWPGQLSPAHALAAISPRPVLLIQGDRDARAPIVRVEQIARAAGDHVEFLKVPGVGHFESLPTHPEMYLTRLGAFFQTYLG